VLLTSPVFTHNGHIPRAYTCEGDDINPSLVIEDIPAGCGSLALIVDDPDAVSGRFVHWVVFNIQPCARIEEDSVPGTQGYNDFRRNDWGGPCPPAGMHRYFFKLYALDLLLDLSVGSTAPMLERAMDGHVIAHAELIGLYKRVRGQHV